MPVPLHGQRTVSGTAQRLTNGDVASQVYTIKAPATNQATVYIGDSNVTVGNGYPLDPGESEDYQKNDQSGGVRTTLNVSDFYVVGDHPGDKAAWLASP